MVEVQPLPLYRSTIDHQLLSITKKVAKNILSVIVCDTYES